MTRLLGGVAALAALALAIGFASMNATQHVTLRLGVVTFYRVPLTVVAFGSLLIGMLVMLLAGIRSDLKVRRILRARLVAEAHEERGRFVDLDQQELFGEGKEES